MRKVFTLMLVLIAVGAFGQKKNKKSTAEPRKFEDPNAVPKPAQQVQAAPQDTIPQLNPMVEHFLRKRNLALKWNDGPAAKDALLDLVVETGSDSLAYLLAAAYYESQQYACAALAAKDLLTVNPKNIDFLQVSAMSFEALGLRDKALPNYESIYLITNNTAVLYKMSNLQYETKRYEEAKASIDILLTRPDLDSLNVSVPLANNKSKDFPIKVAVLNLKGLVLAQTSDKTGARKAFQDALVIAPDFPQAKDNLTKLK